MRASHRLYPIAALLAALTVLASCSSTSNAASDSAAAGTTRSAAGSQVTVPAAGSPSGVSTTTSTTTSTTPVPVASVSASPALGSTDISPTSPLTITVDRGTIKDFALTNAEGKSVQGALSADDTSWALGEVLGYGKTYTATGTALGTDGLTVPITGTFSTVDPADTARTTIAPGDGAVVGVAAPVEVLFGVEPADRAAIEKVVDIKTTPAVEGAWAWIEHDGGTWGLDYRPKAYWPAGTVIHVDANVYGVDFGNGYWGKEDLTSDFTIGRNQVVIADVNSHELVVQRDGVTVASYPASYGKGENADLTTRSGIHVVSDFFETKSMSNPKYGYQNVLEKWAVRISDNGEFIHANPNSTSAQGNTNVTHGCVNLSIDNAQAYYHSAIWGDPVEVTGTDVALSAEDGDIFDWAVPWAYWVTLSGKNA